MTPDEIRVRLDNAVCKCGHAWLDHSETALPEDGCWQITCSCLMTMTESLAVEVAVMLREARAEVVAVLDGLFPEDGEPPTRLRYPYHCIDCVETDEQKALDAALTLLADLRGGASE